MRNANYNYNPKKRGKFYRVVNIIVMTAFLFNMTATQGLLMLSSAQAVQPDGVGVGVDKYTICHATSSDTNPVERLNLPLAALSAHLDSNGTIKAGHEEDVSLGIDNENVLQCPTVIPPMCSEVFADYDLNGDCVINLSDVAMYATAYAAGEVFDATIDYNGDGIIGDLSDVSSFAESISIDPSADLNNDGQSNEDDIACFSAMVGATDSECSMCGNETVEGNEQCDDGNVLDGDGCSANCTEETFSIEGFKFNDENGNHEYDCTEEENVKTVENCEEKLAGWEIQLFGEGSERKDGLLGMDTTSDETEDYGMYAFEDLAPGTYQVCEVQQDGWMQTFPENCHEVTLGQDPQTFDHMPMYNFGNQEETMCEVGATWAYELIANDQGTQYGTGSIDANRSDPMQALGEADSVDGDLGEFYSLGMDGWITLKFQYPVMDVDGDDLSFHEETWGNRSTYGIEKAQVAVSKDGVDWENIGEINNQTADGVDYLDFSSTGWDFVRYVRLTDTTDFAAEFPGNGTADGYDLDAVDATYGTCEEIPDPATVIAKKIVCTEEADLPNWGNGGPSITANTAQDWVNTHESCEFESDWSFQYRVDGGNPYNPGDNTGESVATDWHTFGPTNVNGVSTVEIDLDLANKFWFREVWQDSYIPFTYNVVGNNSNNVSAEFYCHNDVLNYDNLEWIGNMQPGDTYNCVAWNVLEEEPTYDLHGYKWNDLNDNGMYDCELVKGAEQTTVATPPLECEPLMNGWTVFIDENENGILDGEELSKVTSSETEHFGWYWFEDLPAGDYVVCEVQQEGWSQTFPYGNACHTVTLPEIETTGLTMSLNAVEGYEYNFGNIHDKGDLKIVKYDDDQNLMAQVEFQIDGEIYWTNGSGEIVLEDILTGYHIVQEMDTEGYTFTSVYGDNCTNSNPSAANVLEETTTTCVFTNTRDTGELTGLKYDDLNNNGVRDCEPTANRLALINGPVEDPIECEPVLSGWTINIALNTCSENESDYDLEEDGTLNLSDMGVFAQYINEGNVMGDMNNDGVTDQADFSCFSAMYNDLPFPTAPDMSDVTDEYGNYGFTGLMPGSYNIWETQDQQGWMQTSSPEVYTILITAGMEVSEVDFGNYYVGYCGDGIVNGEEMCDAEAGDIPENYHCTQICTIEEDLHSTVSGYKYEDLDGNGIWGEFEQPLNDWEICQVFELGEIGEVGITSLSNKSFAQVALLDEIMENGCVLTGSGDWPDGYYEFKFYQPGHVSVTETMQDGYTKTQPVEASHEIEAVEPTEYSDYRFGNQPDFGVSITKTANVSTIGAGEQFTYTVNWGTSGIITADDVVITDTLPAGVNFVSATDSGIYDNGTRTVTWTLHDVAPETTGSFGITVQTLDSVNNNDQLVNNVEIMATKYLTDDQPAEATALVDPVLTRLDRSATASSTVTVNIAFVGDPLLTITKDASVDNADAGDTISYTVIVTNNGTATATNVMVDDTLPSGMTFVDSGLDTVTLVLGDIIAGDSETITYDVKVADTATTGSYENLAEAYANNHAKVSDSAIVAVTAPIVLGETTEAELALTKSANVEFTNPGGTVEYTLTIANNGTEDAQNVVMTDQLPEGFVFEGTTDAMKVWNFSTIAMGSAETVTYKATVNSNTVAGMYDNVAVATADNSENAGASATVEVRAVSVLGALVETGTTVRDYILYVAGIMLIASGAWFIAKNRKLSHHSK